ncbi:MAG: hypothetical protein B6D58_08625 [candidate division Zixibacteria bacterium 4484_95]|nr:MAG: hypothetical protein B6D58_08625 [candidate division Zixibacteria bacterium 4484_95]
MRIKNQIENINYKYNKTKKLSFFIMTTFGWMVIFALIVLSLSSIYYQKNIRKNLIHHWSSIAKLIAYEYSNNQHQTLTGTNLFNEISNYFIQNNDELIQVQLVTKNNQVVSSVDRLNRGEKYNKMAVVNKALLGTSGNDISSDKTSTILTVAEPIFINGKCSGALVFDINYSLFTQKSLGQARILFFLVLIILIPWQIVLVLIYKNNQQNIFEHNQHLEAMSLIWRKIVNTVELDKILDVTLSEILKMLGMEAGWIYLKDNRTKKLYLAAKKGDTSNYSPPINITSTANADATESPLIGGDVMRQPRNRYHYSQMFRAGEDIPYCYLDIPLNTKKHFMGMLSIAGRRDKPFRIGEEEFIVSLCQQIAIAIENAQLFANLSKQAVELTFLLNTAMISASSFNLGRVLSGLSKEIVETIKVSFCKIFLYEEKKQKLLLKAQYPKTGINPESRNGFSLDETPAHKLTLLSGQPQLLDENNLPDFAGIKEQRFIFAPKTKSILIVPLKVARNTLGCLTIGDTNHKRIKQEDVNLCTTMASQISLSIGNAKLYSDLKQAYTELKETQNKLIQTERLRALGEMSTGIAHDFNNVLSIISGRIELLEKVKPEPDILKHISIMKKATDDGTAIIKRIRNFSRLDRSFNFQVIETARIVKESIDMAENLPQLRKKGKIKIKALLDESCQILADPVEIREVMINMIMNAIDAMPDGGTITIQIKVDDNHSYIIIKDNGIGMDEKTASRVFEPFFTTKGEKGSGMGLSVAYGIISSHNGTIDVNSQPGKGTVFTIKIPLSDPSQTVIYDANLTQKPKTDSITVNAKN